MESRVQEKFALLEKRALYSKLVAKVEAGINDPAKSTWAEIHALAKTAVQDALEERRSSPRLTAIKNDS